MADLNSVCKAAANALEALSHLQPGFASNVSPRLSQNDRQRNVSSTPSAAGNAVPSTSSVQSRLQSCFPTIASRPRKAAKRLNTRKPDKGGRPKKTLVHKDLVLLPTPGYNKVPTHNSRVALEERQLVCHEFPFNKDWDEEALKNAILIQFPRLISFEFVKPCYGKLVKPKLAEGVSYDAERVVKMVGQGAVYVRSLYPLEDEDEEMTDEELYQSVFDKSEAKFDESADSQTNGATCSLVSSTQAEQNSDVVLIQDSSQEFNSDDVIEIPPLETESSSVEPDSFPVITHPCEPEMQLIKLHRVNLKADMINAFKDPSILDCQLSVVVIDSRGNEEKGTGVGVMRDAFSLFWKESYDSFFIGENERVPFIRHDYNRSDWEAMARILVKGYLTCQYLPILMSKTFLSYVLYGESSITGPILIESFRQYISAEERRVVDKCLSGDFNFESEEDYNELLEVLGNFDCRTCICRENAERVIQEIAHKEIIQKTQYITDSWKDILQTLVESFPHVQCLIDRYEEIKPSVSKISNCIQSDPQSDAERECLKFLKRYIKGLDTPQKLSAFMRFISGSELMLFPGVQVTFSELSGFGRRPIARTCNVILEIPSTYQSFPELREEFNHVLMSGNWEIDIN